MSTGNKYNLVILHGWMQNKTLWTSLADKFSQLPQIENVYVPDLPGFGDEPALQEGADVIDYTKWALNYITTKKLENVILLGHSFGGRITAEIAKDNPDWLSEIILYGAPCIYRPSKKLALRIQVNKALGKIIPAGLKKDIIKNITKGEDINSVVGTNMESTFRKSIVFDQTEQLKKINCKAFMVIGENDPEVTPVMQTEMKTLIKHSELLLLPNVAHNIHIENPMLFYGTITKIIQNL